MERPKPYVVEWQHPELVKMEVARVGSIEYINHDRIYAREYFNSLTVARRWFEQTARIHGGQLRERCNIRDVTPLGDPPGILWDYDVRIIDEA